MMKEREIFVEALEREAGPARDEYLVQACSGDDSLRVRVERLLLEHSRPGPSLLDEPIVAGCDSTLTEQSGQWIDRYKLLQVIGEGGFGTVWMAEQKEPVRRRVALKIIKAGMDTKEVVARFEAERQALALMEHPSIAKVLDGGATKNGRPYFVMELVRGAPITEYCDQTKLDTVGRLKLFREVCHAVQHAHQKGVIHRDLKPSNVMVTEHEGRSLPKVIDFGIAKATSSDLTQRTLFTQFRQFIGTPEYMAPEQANQGSFDIDTRADVYSLGVLLYELLTGTKPFDLKSALGTGWDEMMRVIREEEPARPSTRVSTLGAEAPVIARARHATPGGLGKLFRDDLDWIVLKALEKDRERRYATASGFAADIDRFLAREPVQASPPSRVYRLRKLASRNKKTFALAGAILAALLLGVVGTTYGMLRALSAERVASTERDESARQAQIARAVVDFLNEDLLASVDPSESRGRDVTVREVLNNAARTVRAGLANDRELEASIRGTLGQTYMSLGDYEASREHLRRVVELDANEEPAAETLRAQAMLADLSRAEGRLDEAQEQIDEVIERQREVLGALHHDTLRSRLVAGQVLSDRARYDAAEVLFLEVLELMRTTLGEAHRDFFTGRSYLGDLFLRQGRFDEAEAVHRDLLRRRRELLGEDHPDTLRSLGAVASCLWQRKRYSEAEELFRQQLEARRRVLGAEHPLTLAAMSSVATMLTNMGELQAGETMHEEVLALQTRLLGPDAPGSLVSTNNLAVALDRQGRYAEALALYAQLERRYNEIHGPEHPKTLLALSNSGAMLTRLGKLAEAESVQREAYDVRRRVHGPDHPRTMESAEQLLQVLRLQGGREDDARPLQAEVLDYLERAATNPESGLSVVDLLAWELLVAIPEDLRDPERAQELIEDVLRRSDERLPQYLDTYAVALFQNGDVTQAIEIEREAIAAAPRESTLRIEFEKRLAEFEAAADEDG